MQPAFDSEWEALGKLAFRRQERIGSIFRDLQRWIALKPKHPDAVRLCLIKDWLLVPFTLWPIDFAGLASHACKRVRAGRRLEPQLVFALGELQDLPSEEARAAISAYEHLVQEGRYEPLLKPTALPKFTAQQKNIENNGCFHEDWAEFKRTFDVQRFRDRKGIIRRRLVQERNFRTGWNFRESNKRDRFLLAFDAFCQRWRLYGMENDKPLLLKLTVNPTAHGLMIMIPDYWSLDHARDFNWREITRLHKTRGVIPGGPKLSENRVDRLEQARLAYRADQEAKLLGHKGRKRREYVASKANLPPLLDDRSYRRLVAEGREEGRSAVKRQRRSTQPV